MPTTAERGLLALITSSSIQPWTFVTLRMTEVLLLVAAFKNIPRAAPGRSLTRYQPEPHPVPLDWLWIGAARILLSMRPAPKPPLLGIASLRLLTPGQEVLPQR